jgi:hypothetical protein
MKNRFNLVLLFALMITASLSYAAGDDASSARSGCRVMASPQTPELRVSWSGGCSNGYAEGTGVLTWASGNRYEGDVRAGVINGNGTFYWTNGDWYQGEFRDGRRHGVGTHYFGCSGRYQGEFQNGMMHGVGAFYMANGDHYEGEVRNGVMDGVGKYFLSKGNRYEGEFSKGAMQGSGVRFYADGSRYEGEFKRNEQDGVGSLYLANRARYQGEFKSGQPSGAALVTFANGDVYEGAYIEGHVDGRGILTKKNGERDVGIFKEQRPGVLKMMSSIGPRLYEPCQQHCSTTTLSCSSAVMAASADSAFPDPMRAAVDCARDVQRCTSFCERRNPTVRDLKGVIEIDEHPNNAVGESAKNDSTRDTASIEVPIVDSKTLLDFAAEQDAATDALRLRLEQQQMQLQELRQQVARLPRPAVPATLAQAATKKCR